MRIIEVDPTPIAQIAYTRASRCGLAEHAMLDFVAARVDRLPGGLRAIITTGDLQGYDTSRPSCPRLLGEAVAETVADLAIDDRVVSSEVGVILAGDYWAHADLTHRGGAGDVRQVWSAFGSHFRWVCGVPGNHDQFTTVPGDAAFALAAKRQFATETGLHALDDELVQLDALRVAGLGGVIGNPAKPFRRSRERFAQALTGLIRMQPDLLVCHEGFNSHTLDDDSEVEEALKATPDILIVHGHRHVIRSNCCGLGIRSSTAVNAWSFYGEANQDERGGNRRIPM